jgi:hypothetical protein
VNVLLSMANPWHADGPRTVADLELTLLAGTRKIAWVHERADNPGVSITNAAEQVVATVRALFGADVLIVECYDGDSYVEGGHSRATYDLVDAGGGIASWRHLGTTQRDALDVLGTL